MGQNLISLMNLIGATNITFPMLRFLHTLMMSQTNDTEGI
jgi:hypothetical protein